MKQAAQTTTKKIAKVSIFSPLFPDIRFFVCLIKVFILRRSVTFTKVISNCAQYKVVGCIFTPTFWNKHCNFGCCKQFLNRIENKNTARLQKLDIVCSKLVYNAAKALSIPI